MGWFMTTILVPIFAPNLVLWMWASWTHISQEDAKRLRQITPIKDGQLCWIAIAFCASALYELFEPTRSLEPGLKSILLAGLVVVLGASSVVAGGGAAFPAPERPNGVPWHHHYKALKGSLILTVLSAISYSLVHFN